MRLDDIQTVEYWAAVAILLDFAFNHIRHVRTIVQSAHILILGLIANVTAWFVTHPEAVEAAEEVIEKPP